MGDMCAARICRLGSGVADEEEEDDDEADVLLLADKVDDT